MSRDTWNLIKSSKRFYVKTYRFTGTVLLVSCLLNIFFSVAIYYTYFDRPAHDFYATNGVTAPVQLTPLDEANYTSVPLLSSNPMTDNTQKAIPE